MRARAFLIASASLVLIGSGASLTGRPPGAQGQPVGGEVLYERHCAGCHAPEGKGDGPAADLLYPRPRDFTQGTFKVRTTASGDLPTDEDLFQTITRGMPGTAMPGWENLPEADRWRLVRHVKTFSQRFAQEPSLERIPVGSPMPADRETLAKGSQIYRKMKCWECHGEEGRGDGPSAPSLKDDWKFPIRVGNLTKGRNFRGGATVEDIYRTFTTGLDGTPMPSYADSLTEADRWQLAHYIRSLSPDQPVPERRIVIRARALPGALPVSPTDPRWQTAEAAEIFLAGQIVRSPRLHVPSITSLTVRALYNSQKIAFLLQWDDGTESVQKVTDGSFSDAVAIQFPAGGDDGPAKPYFFLGDAERPVTLWLWDAGSASLQEYSARGLGTQSPKVRQRAVRGKGVYRNGQWSVALERSLTVAGKTPDIRFEKGKAVPVAFYAWDGSAGEQWGKGSLSTWHWLILGDPKAQIPGEPAREIHPPLPVAYVALDNPLPSSPEVIRDGKTLYFKNCVFCHGDRLDGRGHFADALDPRPADLTAPETLAQLHESYLFWRIREGGRGLPAESHPWDSAMPRWKDDLSDEEIWKIVRFLYDAIGVTPRSWVE